jgi:HD-GYP domain-containing protein (c-di-GMP phosphodiesterase class II)
MAAASAERYLAIAGHVDCMSRLAEAVALAIGFNSWRARSIRAASKLHDIGKMAIPDKILLKPGPLTAAERAIMQRHTSVGYELLADSGDGMLDLAASVALSHHERWDGTGYPQGLRGEQIPLEARIAAIADVFDALTSPRAYRQQIDAEAAEEVVAEGSGRQFDPLVVNAFLEVRRAKAA